jgi:hypothetical protein
MDAAAVDHPHAGVPQALRLPKKPLERRARILPAEAMEIEVPLYREIAPFEAREKPPALPARGALDSFAGGERVELAPAGYEGGEKGERIGLVVAAPGKLDGRRKTERLLAPAQGSNALHLQLERFVIGEGRREARFRRLPSRRQRVSVQKVSENFERSMARPGRLGHALILRQRHSLINARDRPRAGFDLVPTPR